MTPERLKEIEERAAKATEGPWSAVTQTDADGVFDFVYAFGRHPLEIVDTSKTGSDNKEYLKSRRSNVEFIAHAREDVPTLTARVRELETRLKQIEWKGAGDIPQGQGYCPGCKATDWNRQHANDCPYFTKDGSVK